MLLRDISILRRKGKNIIRTLKRLSIQDNVSEKLYYSDIHPVDTEYIEEILFYSQKINEKLKKENTKINYNG